jgi:Flp pilus assembly protein TadD
LLTSGASSSSADRARGRGFESHEAGRLAEAAGFYRRALADWPQDTDSAHLLGLAEAQLGRPGVALIWISAALATRPRDSACLGNLAVMANSLVASGLVDLSLRAFRQLFMSGSASPEMLNNFAVALERSEQADAAERRLRQAIVLAPAAGEATANLADLCFRQERLELSARWARRAVAGVPHSDSSTTAGNALQRLGRYRAAMTSYRRAIGDQPSHLRAVDGLATTTMSIGAQDKARIWIMAALAIDGTDVSAHNNLATWLLTNGDYRRGLAEYEWRWLRPHASPRRRHPPEWDGATPAGKTILVYPEQGLGDTIQMARYVPELLKLGASVVVECPPPLVRLFGYSVPGATVVASGAPAPRHDVQASFMSLPRLLSTTLESIPARVPYLRIDAELRRHWGSRISGARPRVGLVWQGNPRQFSEPHRSVPLAVLQTLLDLRGISWYGLQRDAGREQLAGLRGDRVMIDLGPDLNDLADTAAVLDHLDLIVTPCTSMAHLAGALGRRVWILLHNASDWRWHLNRADSPWYPTAHLFRQRTPGDWTGVVASVREALSSWCGSMRQ